MARAEQVTKLPLDRWAKLMGINLLHFNGVYVSTPTTCEQPWMQREDQAQDRVSREEVARAIHQAEADIEQLIGYHLLPDWEVDEWNPTIRPNPPELFNVNVRDIRGFHQNVQAQWGWMISGGIKSRSVLDAGATITYSDDDGDGYDETATVTVAVTAGQPGGEVRVFYPGHSGADEWEIRPINVSIAGLVATITFRREQCVLSTAYDDYEPPQDDDILRGVDGTVDANFLTTVDVYRVYNDPQTQVTFMWEPLGCGACEGSGCVLCSYTVQTGCLITRGDPRQSIVAYHPGSWDSDTNTFTQADWSIYRQPDLVRLYYYSGWRDKALQYPTVQMERFWERVVAYYAASLLERPICECSNVRAFIERWQQDLAVTSPGAGVLRSVSPKVLDCPWGTLRGAWYAYRFAADRALGRGVVLT